MPTSEQQDHLADLAKIRALAAAELEMDCLLTRAVVAARKRKTTWKEVAEAAGVSINSAWGRWSRMQKEVKPGRSGHERTREIEDTTPPELQGLSLLQKAIRQVLDGLGEPYEELLPFEPDTVDLQLLKRPIVISCDGVNVVVRQIGHQRKPKAP